MLNSHKKKYPVKVFNISNELAGISILPEAKPFPVSYIMTYTEQIKDGRWQRKRLEVMQRDDFRCRVCESPNQLTVHHLYYLPKTEIWNYDNEGLITICENCHNNITFDLAKLSGIIAFRILTKDYDFLKEISVQNFPEVIL